MKERDKRWDWLAYFFCDYIWPHRGFNFFGVRVLERAATEVPGLSLKRPVFVCRICYRALVTTSVRVTPKTEREIRLSEERNRLRSRA